MNNLLGLIIIQWLEFFFQVSTAKQITSIYIIINSKQNNGACYIYHGFFFKIEIYNFIFLFFDYERQYPVFHHRVQRTFGRVNILLWTPISRRGLSKMKVSKKRYPKRCAWFVLQCRFEQTGILVMCLLDDHQIRRSG